MVKAAIKYKSKIYTYLSAEMLTRQYKGIEFIPVSLPHQGVCVQDSARDQVLFIPCENISYVEYEGASKLATTKKSDVKLNLS